MVNLNFNIKGWIIIMLVVLMSVINMGYIIPYKIIEAINNNKKAKLRA